MPAERTSNDDWLQRAWTVEQVEVDSSQYWARDSVSALNMHFSGVEHEV